MQQNIDYFSHYIIGRLNLGTFIQLFKLLLATNSQLTKRQQKELLLQWGVALKGQPIKSIAKSLERMSLYSADPSLKSRTRLSEAEKKEAALRLTTFLAAEETRWAANKTTKIILLHELATLLTFDPHYLKPSKRQTKRLLNLLTQEFYQQIDTQEPFNNANYYTILTAYFTELLGNLNLYKFAGKYTLYEHSCYISEALVTTVPVSKKSPDPNHILASWVINQTKRIEELYDHFSQQTLPLNEIAAITIQKEQSAHSVSLARGLVQSCPPARLPHLKELVCDVTLSAFTYQTILATQRHYLIHSKQSHRTLFCAYRSLFSQGNQGGLRTFPLSFKPFPQNCFIDYPPYLLHKPTFAQTLQMTDLSRFPKKKLPQLITYAHYYNPQSQTFYYDSIDYYTHKAREAFFNHPASFCQQVAPTPDEQQFFLKLYQTHIVAQAPETLMVNLKKASPFHLKNSLLIKTSDNFLILTKRYDSLKNTTNLTFSLDNYLNTPIPVGPLDPIKIVAHKLQQHYQHNLDRRQLSLFSLGIDYDSYAQQLIFLYEVEQTASVFLETATGSLSALLKPRFALPIIPELIFNICQHYSVNQALVYTMLKLCQQEQPTTVHFKIISN